MTTWYDPIGVWRACLHERGLHLKWFAEALSWHDLPRALEGKLCDPQYVPVETEEGKRIRAAALKAARKVDKKS